jgi:hypothetical protein
VGQSRQKGRARENQHRDNNPNSDLMVGSPRILWEGWCTDDELDEWERQFIQDVEQRPRLNWKLNEDNPQQIPIPRQKEQRWARDDQAGRPRWEPAPYRPEAYRPPVVAGNARRWVHPADRGVSGRTVASTVVRKPRKAWRPWQKHLLGIGITWLLLTIAGWVGLGYAGLLEHDTAIIDPVVALVAGVWGWFGLPLAGKRWRRRFRNARRRFR